MCLILAGLLVFMLIWTLVGKNYTASSANNTHHRIRKSHILICSNEITKAAVLIRRGSFVCHVALSSCQLLRDKANLIARKQTRQQQSVAADTHPSNPCFSLRLHVHCYIIADTLHILIIIQFPLPEGCFICPRCSLQFKITVNTQECVEV